MGEGIRVPLGSVTEHRCEPENDTARVVSSTTRNLLDVNVIGTMLCGGEDCHTHLVDGILHIKAACGALGYLNAPSPFDDEGWFDTQDEVDVDGEWIRLKGRRSEIINVGGEKVYPAEVESVMLDVGNVADATVTGEKNVITGNIVVASCLKSPELRKEATWRIRQHCMSKVPRYKVPVRFEISKPPNLSDRFEKIRGET